VLARPGIVPQGRRPVARFQARIRTFRATPRRHPVFRNCVSSWNSSAS
jgi:hypothetical protein